MSRVSASENLRISIAIGPTRYATSRACCCLIDLGKRLGFEVVGKVAQRHFHAIDFRLTCASTAKQSHGRRIVHALRPNDDGALSECHMAFRDCDAVFDPGSICLKLDRQFITLHGRGSECNKGGTEDREMVNRNFRFHVRVGQNIPTCRVKRSAPGGRKENAQHAE